jgi:hypothetical protein
VDRQDSQKEEKIHNSLETDTGMRERILPELVFDQRVAIVRRMTHWNSAQTLTFALYTIVTELHKYIAYRCIFAEQVFYSAHHSLLSISPMGCLSIYSSPHLFFALTAYVWV